MTVTSKQEAWNKVNEIFPTDYEQDMNSSSRAGYPIYRSTAEGHYYDYICDLGTSLEVNLDSSRKPTVRINIVEPTVTDEDAKAGVEAMYAAKALGQSITPLFELRQYTHISLVIDGGSYNTDATMRKVYDGLKRGESWLASDVIASYCESHGIRWGTIQDTKASYYAHGKSDEDGGHFVVEGYIGLREP